MKSQRSALEFVPSLRDSPDKANPTRRSRAGLQVVSSLRDWLRYNVKVSSNFPSGSGKSHATAESQPSAAKEAAEKGHKPFVW